jgi:hypothetical protein
MMGEASLLYSRSHRHLRHKLFILLGMSVSFASNTSSAPNAKFSSKIDLRPALTRLHVQNPFGLVAAFAKS